MKPCSFRDVKRVCFERIGTGTEHLWSFFFAVIGFIGFIRNLNLNHYITWTCAICIF